MTDISSFGVSVRLETLPQETVGGGSGFFGGLLGRKKNEKVEEEEGAWAKHTSLYPYRSPVPGKQKTGRNEKQIDQERKESKDRRERKKGKYRKES